MKPNSPYPEGRKKRDFYRIYAHINIIQSAAEAGKVSPTAINYHDEQKGRRMCN